MKDKEKQIEEMAKDLEPFITLHREVYVSANRKERHAWMLSEEDNEVIAESLVAKGYRKLPEDSVVLSREEYEEYQSFKNGDYCATKCDIHELSFNQMNKISDLENENEKLKNEIKNPNEVLEDRERFRARNEELKGITEQLRQEIITLSQELVNSRKETAERDFSHIIKALEIKKASIITHYGVKESVGADVAIRTVKEIAKQFGVEIKE